MDPITITLICGMVVTTVGGVLAAFRKNIKKSSCFGSVIEFRSSMPPTPMHPSHTPSLRPSPDNAYMAEMWQNTTPTIRVNPQLYIPQPQFNELPVFPPPKL